MTGSEHRPVWAARLAAELGDRLPGSDVVTPAALELTAAARSLVEAVVMTDVDDGERTEVAAAIAVLAGRLRSRRRIEPWFLVRHPDGRVESLLQAGSGRLNPQAPPVEWIERPPEPQAGTEPVPQRSGLDASSRL